MEDFPTLPPYASIAYGDIVYEDPVLRADFENGREQTRARWSRGRYVSFTVVYRLPEWDADTVIQFLQARRLQNEPFRFFHPLIGTDVVRYARDELPMRVMIQGNPVWYEMELEFRQQF